MSTYNLSPMIWWVVSFFFCSELLVPEMSRLFSDLHLFITSLLLHVGFSLVMRNAALSFLSFLPTSFFTAAAWQMFLMSRSFSLWPFFVWLVLTENTLQLCGCLKVLPGWYIAVVHVGCHHHPSSSSVALETKQVKWRQSSKLGWHFKWNPTEFTFLQCYMSLHRSIKIKKLLLHDHT